MPRTSTPPPDSTESHGGSTPGSIADALAQLGKYWREFRANLAFYLMVQMDRILLSIKTMVIVGAVSVLVLVGLGAMLVMGVVQICSGIAQLFAEAFGGRMWAGDLLTGGIIWIAVLATTYFGVSKLIAKSRKATLEKYEQLRSQQPPKADE
ncbi:MAG TPA: hypothetical protein VGG19_13785 [Tepidisphaeraceae bacterium]|jgi:hypothetical protein